MGANSCVGRKLNLGAGACLVACFTPLAVLVSHVTGKSSVAPFKITTSSSPLYRRVRGEVQNMKQHLTQQVSMSCESEV